ncbi:unnamed protein product [Albugo candida]|uniref:Uncharacterized protein n=1 Tax=Albugo candida TaxID=65357 RepID=A0A024G6E8_9STRA|nr:unnamed protein product [Albugo candida]|eukprot:CCI42253.1 unnamed protein product [Albugo candida]
MVQLPPSIYKRIHTTKFRCESGRRWNESYRQFSTEYGKVVHEFCALEEFTSKLLLCKELPSESACVTQHLFMEIFVKKIVSWDVKSE